MMCFINDEICSFVLIFIVFNCVIHTDIVPYIGVAIVSAFLELCITLTVTI